MTVELSAETQNSYAKLAEWLVKMHRAHTQCDKAGALVVGVHGAQGSGKTTCAHWLKRRLAAEFDLQATVLSLDDFYLPRVARESLADAVHPLLQTRGVPGTHDVARGTEAIRSLRHLGTGEAIEVPQFDKSIDDRSNTATCIHGPVDIVFFEGWCVGLSPQDQSALNTPVNVLEEQEDPEGQWRRYVHAQLCGPYSEWFAEIDVLVMLKVPGWEQVFEWRSQQERDTAARAPEGHALMNAEQLRRFMDHYERLTRHALATLPEQADVLLQLDLAHSVLVEHMR